MAEVSRTEIQRTAVRPAVLLMESGDERRRFLSQELAAAGYEVVPAVSAEEARRFAEGLGPSVIVGPPTLVDADILDHAQTSKTARHEIERTLLVLADEGEEPADLPDGVRFLPVAGLDDAEIARRVRLVLIGREIGVEPDLELRSLVGELALMPILELVRSLHDVRLTGRLAVAGGAVVFVNGEVMTAAAKTPGGSPVRGSKAFCRLARMTHGPFRVSLGEFKHEPDITENMQDLVLRALEELHIELPPLRARLRPLSAEREAAKEISYSHRDLLLAMVAQCDTVGELLDGLPATDGRLVQAINKMVDTGYLRIERPRADVTVMTDSTSDLPPELALEHGIEVVPLSVVFGDDILRDGVDIQARDFYQMLTTVRDHPSTQPPTPAEFFEQYLLAIEERDVVSVHISEKLSQTVAHASEAAERGLREITGLPEERRDFTLKTVDSENVSMGVGLLALFAARMAYRGENAAAIVRRLEKMRTRIHTLFAVDTLDYLVKGGRIGKARGLIGKLLGIKPILGVVDGEVASVDKVRGGRQAHPRIIKLLQQRIDSKKPITCAVAHASAPVWADRLQALMAKEFEILEMIETDIGPVVGTHAGPGCVGTVVFQPEGDELELVAPLD